jgi:hypothetical protein
MINRIASETKTVQRTAEEVQKISETGLWIFEKGNSCSCNCSCYCGSDAVVVAIIIAVQLQLPENLCD